MPQNRNSYNARNPRNSENSLYKKLTRLFSGPIVNWDRQTPRKLRRRDLDIRSKWIKSAGGAPFKKSAFNPYSKLSANYFSNHNRAERYVDFDQMEYSPEIATALDIYADEITTSSELRELLTIKCPNQEVKTVLQNLYHNIMNLEHNMFGWSRTTCKYGDFFLYLEVDDDEGIKRVFGLPSIEVERLEGEDENNPNYVQFQWNSGGQTFENWQIAHFRILGQDKYHPYGTSILEPARRIFRQLDLLENAMMAYRIVRSPERRVFYIDVGHIEPDDIEQYVLKMQANLKKHSITDDDTGRVDLRYNPMNIEEDYFIPVRGKDRGTKIDTLPGGQWTGDVDDVKYLREKLLTAIKIPGEYLMSGEGDGQQSSLAQKDIRFARTILRLQKSIVSELVKVGQIHLFTLGYRGEDLTNFKLTLNNPSQLAELQELESWRTKFEVAAAANEGFFSRRWIYEKLFGLTKEEIRRIEIERFTDKKMDALYELAGEEVTSEMGGGLGELEDLAALEGELGGPDIEGTAAEVGAEGPEGGSLRAAPGKRDFTTTPASKGKLYKPEVTDSRQSGARNRHYNSLGGINHIGRSEKSRLPGMQKLRRVGMGTAREVFDRQLSLFTELLDNNLKSIPSADSLENYVPSNSEKLLSTYNDNNDSLFDENVLFEEIGSIEELSLLIEKNISADSLRKKDETET